MTEKRVSVKLVGEAKEEYLKLKETVRREKEKGVSASFHQTLLRGINAKIALLKQKCDYGTQIPRKLIPRKYVTLYGVTNLWKVELPGFWRLVYTLKQPQRGDSEVREVEVLFVWLDVLDIKSHPDYDELFSYRKK